MKWMSFIHRQIIIISYHLFASADTRMYLHAACQYHAWPHQHSVYSVAAQRQGNWAAVGITIVTSSMTFLSFYISRWWHQTRGTPLYFTVVNQSEARIRTEHGINNTTPHLRCEIQRIRPKRFKVQSFEHGGSCVFGGLDGIGWTLLD